MLRKKLRNKKLKFKLIKRLALLLFKEMPVMMILILEIFSHLESKYLESKDDLSLKMISKVRMVILKVT